DPRFKKAEVDSFEAQRAERGGDATKARALHHAAAEGFGAVALAVPNDHPQTRTDLAIAAVASFARAGDLRRATEFGLRMLVESAALTKEGIVELQRLVHEYETLAATIAPTPPALGHTQGVRKSDWRLFTRKFQIA